MLCFSYEIGDIYIHNCTYIYFFFFHVMPYFSVFTSTADALTTVLTKINRLDIVTLLEGPIFDYGNVSGTRCFVDDNVFRDQADGKVALII